MRVHWDRASKEQKKIHEPCKAHQTFRFLSVLIDFFNNVLAKNRENDANFQENVLWEGGRRVAGGSASEHLLLTSPWTHDTFCGHGVHHSRDQQYTGNDEQVDADDRNDV